MARLLLPRIVTAQLGAPAPVAVKPVVVASPPKKDPKRKYSARHRPPPPPPPEPKVVHRLKGVPSLAGSLKSWLRDHPEDTDAITNKLVLMAKHGDLRAIKEVFNRIDGRAIDRIALVDDRATLEPAVAEAMIHAGLKAIGHDAPAHDDGNY